MNTQATKSAHRALDPRPARTRAAILDAIERLENRGEELNVSTVVAEAGLSRSSFYSQFKDLGDVAVQLVSLVYENQPDAEGTTAAARIEEMTHRLIADIDERRALYAAVLTNRSGASPHIEVCRIMARSMLQSLKSEAPAKLDPALAARFIAAGYLSNIIEWLDAKSPSPATMLEEQLSRLLPKWIN